MRCCGRKHVRRRIPLIREDIKEIIILSGRAGYDSSGLFTKGSELDFIIGRIAIGSTGLMIWAVNNWPNSLWKYYA